jgi:hypothetical protein
LKRPGTPRKSERVWHDREKLDGKAAPQEAEAVQEPYVQAAGGIQKEGGAAKPYPYQAEAMRMMPDRGFRNFALV